MNFKVLKTFTLGFLVLWIYNVITMFYQFISYESVYEHFYIRIFGFLTGMLLSPAIIFVLSIIFWMLYKLKYQEEKVWEKKGKKIIYSLLAMLLINFIISGRAVIVFFCVGTVWFFEKEIKNERLSSQTKHNIV